MTPRQALSLSAAALLAAGCAPLLFGGGGPAPQVYRLTPPQSDWGRGTTAGGEPLDWTVEIARPVASRALSTDRIAVSPQGSEIAYASGARWQSTAPNLLQEYLVARFDADDRMMAAVRPGDSVAATCQLRIDLTAFEAVYRDGELAPPQAHVRLTAKLVAGVDRALAGIRVIDIEEPAAEPNLRSIVAAFDRAVREASEELIGWTLQLGGEDDGEGGLVCDPAQGPRPPTLRASVSSDELEGGP